ncbi:UNVERIFIED_CONTAM: hypothetical protein B566_EDAN019410 [Ephemera danica]|nr:hypothetical protein B566_EDAN019410 [Ephemera danica]
MILRLFLDRGMPALDKSFRHHPEEVTTLLKDCQKLTSSLGMVQLVPSMKYLLEKMVYRTKSMLMVNGCAQAFWMGNLKNRNLKGEEIPSQMDAVSNHL